MYKINSGPLKELDRELSGLKEFTTCRVVGERKRYLNCVVRFLNEKLMKRECDGGRDGVGEGGGWFDSSGVMCFKKWGPGVIDQPP